MFEKREDTPMSKTKSVLSRLYNNINSRKSTYFLVYSVIFLVLAIGVFSFYFFTGKTFIWEVDGWEQHYKALIYYSEYLRDFFKNIFVNHDFSIRQWDFAIGEGSDVLGTMHYYVIGDPFSFFCFLCPARYMYIFYELMILLRIYVAGIIFSCFCFFMGHDRRFVLPGTLAYSFCYWAIYNAVRHPFFLNPLVFFPLLVYGIEKILKNQRPYLFIIAVMLSSLSNFYFFYMLVFTTIIYVVARLAVLYGRDMKQWMKTIFKAAISSVTGLIMSGVVFLPMLYFFMTDSRFKSQNKFSLVYPLSYYMKLPGLFSIEGDTFWTCMGFAVPVLLAVLLMFKTRKKYRTLKLYFIICAVIMIIPFFGQVLNGFSYMCNRWIYSFAMLCSYILVCMMPKLLSLDKKDRKYLLLILFIYLALGLCIKFSRNWIFVYVVLIGIALVFILSSEKLKSGVKFVSVTAAVILTALGNGVWKNAPFGDNYAAQCVSVDKARQEVLGEDTSLVIDYANVSDGEMLRYSGSGLSYNSNCISGISSSNMYWTLINSSVSGYRYNSALRLDTLLPHKYTGYDDRTFMTELSGASYYVVPKSGGLVPYGYSYVTENDRYILYHNDNSLPLGYTYDKAVSDNEWNNLSYADKQELMMSAAVIKGLNSSESNASDVKYTSQNVKYTVEFDPEKIQHTGRSFAVTQKGASVTFKFDGLEKSEVYFNINGLEYDGASEFQLYYGKDKYDPEDIYSKERWKKLDVSERKRIFRNFIYWTQNISQVKLDITASSGVNKFMNYFTDDYSYYSDQHDFMVNMGYSDEKVTSITVSFEKLGVYSFDSINIICQPMTGYEEKVNALKENVMTDVTFATNTVTGKISLDESKYLCITVPYSKGWKAYVDGEKTEVYNANGQYMALKLEAGKHNIRLVYNTPFLKAGAVLSLFGIVIFIVYIIVWEKQNRKLNERK